MHEFYFVIAQFSSGKNKKSCWQKLLINKINTSDCFLTSGFYNGTGCGNVSLIELLADKKAGVFLDIKTKLREEWIEVLNFSYSVFTCTGWQPGNNKHTHKLVVLIRDHVSSETEEKGTHHLAAKTTNPGIN